MTRSIWSCCPSGMPSPPLLPSERHPRLICNNLINTLTATPGLFTDGSAPAVMSHTQTHTLIQCMHTGFHRCAADSADGGRRRIVIALDSNTLTRTHNVTVLHFCTLLEMYVLLVRGCVALGNFLGLQYTSSCSLNDAIRLWSDGAPD